MDVTTMTSRERSDAAHDPDTPPDLLEQLAADPEWNVRHWVAHHPNTPAHVREQLS